jgi:hypothetical protein
MVSVEVGDDLEASFEGDDLPFQVALEDPVIREMERRLRCGKVLTLEDGCRLPGRIPPAPPLKYSLVAGCSASREKRWPLDIPAWGRVRGGYLL